MEFSQCEIAGKTSRRAVGKSKFRLVLWHLRRNIAREHTTGKLEKSSLCLTAFPDPL
jgi:hypothetical protein